jgi:hypothetical protein
MSAYPATVGLFCGNSNSDYYLFEFVYDAAGHMTGLAMTPRYQGSHYVDDVTKSFMLQDE